MVILAVAVGGWVAGFLVSWGCDTGLEFAGFGGVFVCLGLGLLLWWFDCCDFGLLLLFTGY